jgi:hypothetical protein
LTWDASRQSLILVGGFHVTTFSLPITMLRLEALDDIWEWDGARWRRVVTSRQSTPRGGHVAMMAPDGSGTLVVGGAISTGTEIQSVVEPVHLLRWSADIGDETCVTRVDADGDGLASCKDPDCWPACTPLCPPGATWCTSVAPRCGNGTCDPGETMMLCAEDCGVPAPACGDLVCDGSESCAGDCP